MQNIVQRLFTKLLVGDLAKEVKEMTNFVPAI